MINSCIELLQRADKPAVASTAADRLAFEACGYDESKLIEASVGGRQFLHWTAMEVGLVMLEAGPLFPVALYTSCILLAIRRLEPQLSGLPWSDVVSIISQSLDHKNTKYSQLPVERKNAILTLCQETFQHTLSVAEELLEACHKFGFQLYDPEKSLVLQPLADGHFFMALFPHLSGKGNVKVGTVSCSLSL